MSPVRLELQRGDIVSARADVCVSSIHRSKDLTMGPLARRILKSGGNTIQDELFKREPGKELKMGQVEIVPPGKLHNFRELNFVCLRSYQPGNEEVLLQSILECLELAAIGNYKSVAFPAIGVGHGFPAEKVAACLIEAVTLHNYQFPKTSLDVVYVVLLDQDEDVIKAFLLMCVRGTTDLQADATNQPPSDEVHDLADSVPDLRTDGTFNFNSLNKQTPSGAVLSGKTQKAPTLPQQMPNVTGQKKKGKPANQPFSVNPVLATVLSFIKGAGYSRNVGPLNFIVKPKLSNRRLGVQLSIDIDISFLDTFIPVALRKFWQSISS